MVVQSVDTPYIEVTEEALECSFRSFEIAEVISEKAACQKPSSLTLQHKVMNGYGWYDGKGLGKHLQGDCELVEWPSQDNTFGLGFQPSRKEKLQMKEKKRNKRLARFREKCMEMGKMEFPHISQSFVSAGWINTNHQQDGAILVQYGQEALENVSIQAIDDTGPSYSDSLIFLAESDTKLDNWSTMEIPTMFSDKM